MALLKIKKYLYPLSPNKSGFKKPSILARSPSRSGRWGTTMPTRQSQYLTRERPNRGPSPQQKSGGLEPPVTTRPNGLCPQPVTVCSQTP